MNTHTSSDEIASGFRGAFQVVVDQTRLPGDELPAMGLSPAPAGERRRSAGLAAALAGFAAVVLIGSALWLVIPNDGQPDVGSDGVASGIGTPGTYFALGDPSWVLKQAFGDAASSVSIYERGQRQTIIMTGAVATEGLANQDPELRGSSVTMNGADVTRYDWPEGVSYAWVTPDGLQVVVTFGQMAEEEALLVSRTLRPIDVAGWEALISKAELSPPTTAPSGGSD